MNHKEREYLLVRAAQERAKAEEASDELVRSIHEKLAREYDVRANIGQMAAKAVNDVI